MFMKEIIDRIFKTISLIKNIKPIKYNIDIDDHYIMRAFYVKLKGVIKYKVWKKIVIDYSIETQKDIYDSCDDLVDVIYKKYSK